MNELEIGTVPAEEQCQQVGTADYDAISAKKECRIYKEYLQRLFPVPPTLEDEVSYRIKSSAHDFGNYYEVAIEFNSENSEAVEFAYNVEAKSPLRWDAKALEELRSLGLIECE
ncbi:hypothetical protein [Nostoc sp. DedQUE07]|uniref:hypothetical protein n=1 Tax=Nostoc sp. DedQUE07 TaxID=3075392 RepID=UPI002AD41EBA|nr:hypothetical protein [Nostoc sp. DedQUE07]MDZ8131895.1 hypothetical protein [Nostoc sp. DedQUE07]